MPVFHHGEVEIAYRDEGEGQPILLIHGFGSNIRINWESTGWLQFLLDRGRRIVAMDVRGHGDSAKLYDPEAYRLPVMASDAAGLIDSLGIARVDVMGYSMGARIAASLALARPDLVRTLVFGGMATGLFEGIGGEDEIVAALLADVLDETHGARARGYRNFADKTGSDRKALAACMQAQRELVSPDRLAAVRIPTLVAVGAEDDVAGSADRLADLMPSASAFHIAGRDHMLATGDRTFKERVAAFLDEAG